MGFNYIYILKVSECDSSSISFPRRVLILFIQMPKILKRTDENLSNSVTIYDNIDDHSLNFMIINLHRLAWGLSKSIHNYNSCHFLIIDYSFSQKWQCFYYRKINCSLSSTKSWIVFPIIFKIVLLESNYLIFHYHCQK